MGIVKNSYISIKAYLTDTAKEMQNHDELTKVGIKELNAKFAKAQVQYQRLLQQQARIKNDITENQNLAETWQSRAAIAAKNDEEKALTCLKRKQLAEQKVKYLETEFTKINESEVTLNLALEQLKNKLEQVKNQRQIFLAREAKNKAASSIYADNSSSLDEIFGDWEAKVMETEITDNCLLNEQLDSLDEEFKTQEAEAELLNQLAELKNKS